MKNGWTTSRGVLAALAIIMLSGCGIGGDGAPDGPSSSLSNAVAALTVADEDRAGYERESFSDWTDPDRDGCDTRQEVLIAEDVSGTATAEDCDGKIPGEWVSLYDDERVTDSGKLDIDHFVPLAEAWDSGASEWSAERRAAYATYTEDERHLVAVTASSNRSKADKDPSEWLPPDESTHCEYVATWVAIKAQWDLTIDAAELAALKEIAVDCTDTDVVIVSID